MNHNDYEDQKNLPHLTNCLQIARPRPVPPYFRAWSALACIYFLNNDGNAFSVKKKFRQVVMINKNQKTKEKGLECHLLKNRKKLTRKHWKMNFMHSDFLQELKNWEPPGIPIPVSYTSHRSQTIFSCCEWLSCSSSISDALWSMIPFSSIFSWDEGQCEVSLSLQLCLSDELSADCLVNGETEAPDLTFSCSSRNPGYFSDTTSRFIPTFPSCVNLIALLQN